MRWKKSADAHRYVLYYIAHEALVYEGYIKAGDEDKIPTLIDSLSAYGDKQMAETFLNCGNQRLMNAAKEWASAHGYTITPGGGNYAAWGGG